MDRINMSLDDIMAAKASAMKNNKKRNPKPAVVKSKAKPSVGKIRQPAQRAEKSDSSVKINMPGAQSKVAEKALSVFARMGKPPVSGTRVSFANLKASVSEHDLRELCTSMGEIKEIDFVIGRSGRNSATVLFARRSEALKCVSSLNGMTLDGMAMEVSVTGEPSDLAPKSVFDRLQGVPATKNVRQGLFGTAMDDGDDSSAPARGSGPSFSVSLSGAQGGRPVKLVQPFSVPASNNSESQQGFQRRPRSGSHGNGGNGHSYMQHDDRNEGPARKGGRGGRGDRSRREGRGGGKREAAPTKPEDLDADMDAYWAKK